MTYAFRLMARETFSYDNDENDFIETIYEAIVRLFFVIYLYYSLCFLGVGVRAINLIHINTNNVMNTCKIFILEVYLILAIIIITTSYTLFVSSINYLLTNSKALIFLFSYLYIIL